ncbi:hypothetical protein HaLaN_10750, partial [Haematococcus lacustris]
MIEATTGGRVARACPQARQGSPIRFDPLLISSRHTWQYKQRRVGEAVEPRLADPHQAGPAVTPGGHDQQPRPHPYTHNPVPAPDTYFKCSKSRCSRDSRKEQMAAMQELVRQGGCWFGIAAGLEPWPRGTPSPVLCILPQVPAALGGLSQQPRPRHTHNPHTHTRARVQGRSQPCPVPHATGTSCCGGARHALCPAGTPTAFPLS